MAHTCFLSLSLCCTLVLCLYLKKKDPGFRLRWRMLMHLCQGRSKRMNTWTKEQEESIWFFRVEEKESKDLRSAAEKRTTIFKWCDSVTVLPFSNPHARLRAHKRYSNCLYIYRLPAPEICAFIIVHSIFALFLKKNSVWRLWRWQVSVIFIADTMEDSSLLGGKKYAWPTV